MSPALRPRYRAPANCPITLPAQPHKQTQCQSGTQMSLILCPAVLVRRKTCDRCGCRTNITQNVTMVPPCVPHHLADCHSHRCSHLAINYINCAFKPGTNELRTSRHHSSLYYLTIGTVREQSMCGKLNTILISKMSQIESCPTQPLVYFQLTIHQTANTSSRSTYTWLR